MKRGTHNAVNIILLSYPMQIAGLSCSFCEERIAFVNDARGCEACQIVWHLDCHPGKDTCPRCGTDVTRKAAKDADNQAEKLTRQISLGRSIYWLALGGYLSQVVVVLFLILRGYSFDLTPVVLKMAARVTVYLVIWTYAYTGSSRARRLLGFLAAVGLFFIATASMGSTTLFIVSLISLLFTVWACWFSPQVKIYESTRRR